MEQLKVLQVVTTLARGGAQATVMASRDMSSYGVSVVVASGLDDPGEGTYWSEVNSDRCSLGEVVAIPSMHRGLNLMADIKAVMELVAVMRDYRPDLVHTHSAKAGLLGRLAAKVVGIPVVHTVHGWSVASPTWRPPAPKQLTRIQRAMVSLLYWGSARSMVVIERIMARLTNALVVVSPLDAEAGLAMKIGTPTKYRVIRSGVDLGVSARARHDQYRIRSVFGNGATDPDQFVVGTVARLVAQKDLEVLIDGYSEFAQCNPNSSLVVIGEGPELDSLKCRAESKAVGDRVVFVGAHLDAARLVAGFDVFVLTSRWEGLPRSLVEAMSARVPVVATPVGSVPELVVDGKTGRTIPVGDPAAVTESLYWVAANRASAAAMADRAVDNLEEFSDHLMRRKLASLWQQVSQGPNHCDVRRRLRWHARPKHPSKRHRK